jgi:hypothetical protein
MLYWIFWIPVAILTLVVVPIAMVVSTINYFRGRGSDRVGSRGISNGIGAALQELDRIIARPSVEHQVEAEQPVLKRTDSGSE